MKFLTCFVIAAVLLLVIVGGYFLVRWLKESAPEWLISILGFLFCAFMDAVWIWAFVNY